MGQPAAASWIFGGAVLPACILNPVVQCEQVSNQTLGAMLENNEVEASKVSAELQEMRSFLEGEGEGESSQFLKVLQVVSVLCDHT